MVKGQTVIRQRTGETMAQPLLFGYLRIRITDDPGRAYWGQRLIRDYAEREGYTLAQVFVEENENAPCAALVQLIDAARHREGAAVAVPDRQDLGSYAPAQHQLRRRLPHEAGVPVIVIAAPDPSR
jgi:hypothetical protein